MSNVAVRSFAAGELAPALHANTNLAKYASALRTCLNFVVMRAGGVQNRPGTLCVGAVRGDVDDPVRLIPWVRSDAEAYCLVLTDRRLRVVLNGSYVPWGAVPAWTNVTTYAAGDVVVHAGTNYECLVGHLSSPLTEPGVGGVWASWWAVTTDPAYAAATPYSPLDLPAVKLAQDATVMTLTHPDYPVQELTRVADDDWVMAGAVFGPTQADPTGVNATGGAASATSTDYVVAAVSAEAAEESAGAVTVAYLVTPDAANPVTVAWAAPAGVGSYRIYKRAAGSYFGIIGTAPASATSFIDDGIEPDGALQPPAARDPFDATDKYPGAVTHYQQRRVFARTNALPETSWASRSALPKNFTVSSVVRDDDAITWTLRGKRVNEVRHLMDHDDLLQFTSHGVYVDRGDANGVLTPAGVNPRQVSPYGSSDLGTLAPISVGLAALYAVARGTGVRALAPTDSGSYGGDDITVAASHLFEGYSLVDWALQETPDPVLWVVRSDGALLGCTYVPEAGVLAWHRHTIAGGAADADGVATVEAVAVVPEGAEDVLYLAVRRTINGTPMRNVERLGARTLPAAPTDRTELDDDPRVLERVGFLDGAVVSDAWVDLDPGATALVLSGASYAAGQSLTLTATGFAFGFGNEGNTYILEGTDGERVRVVVTANPGAATLTVEPESPVPASLRGVDAARYAEATATINVDLAHLEGESVGVVADGEVVANPLDPDLATVTVTGGAVTLPRAYAHVRVGLAYESDLETLDIDLPGGSSVKPERRVAPNKVGLQVLRTRALRVGPDEDHLNEVKMRRTSTWAGLPPLETGYYEASIAAGYTSHGRVLVRNRDPLPATVLAIMPAGNL